MLHGTLACMAQATPIHGPGLQLSACDNVFIWFLDQENIGLDPQIMILREVISEILEISFCDSWKFPNEIVPLMEDHGWGGVGVPRQLTDYLESQKTPHISPSRAMACLLWGFWKNNWPRYNDTELNVEFQFKGYFEFSMNPSISSMAGKDFLTNKGALSN